MKIVADERIAALDATFARHGELLKSEGRAIERGMLEDADALLTRTVTRVDQGLLEGTPVRFVGTATIGTDHLDIAWLDEAGLRWASAPGCNADATAQYTLAMYLLACRRLDADPLTQSFGIVGRGNVGERLLRMLGALGIAAIANDPPLEAHGKTDLRPLEDVLECDVVSLHVPLTRGGRWPTYRMLDEAAFERLDDRALLINASRGDVVDGAALKRWLRRGGRAALDVWPGEPEIDPEVLENAVVTTPHIAGYSLDGKYRASAIVYKAFCSCFGFEPEPTPTVPADPPAYRTNIHDDSFTDRLLEACPVERDDSQMRRLLDASPEQRVAAFGALRDNYPLRRDLNL